MALITAIVMRQEEPEMPDFTIRTDDLERIATACKTSSETLDTEAGALRRHVSELQEALQGIPNIAQADRFEELNRKLAEISEALQESNGFITRIVNEAEQFIGLARS
jgi:hypothetical protein